MKKLLLGFALILVLGLTSFVNAIDYNEIRLSNNEFVQGKTLEIHPNDKIIFDLDGSEYSIIIDSVGITSYTNDNTNFNEYGIVGISVSENNPKTLTTIPPLNNDKYEYYTDERKFEVNYDFYYDVYVKLEETSLENYQNGTTRITIKKINTEVPEDAVLNYYCAKFYKCPSGERVRYTEMRGQGCGAISNSFSLCKSEFSSCYASYYTCEGSGKRITVCKQVGEEGTLSYGCECLKDPEKECPVVDNSDDKIINDSDDALPEACSQEAKMCSDGSSVTRIGPNCEFGPCPNNISNRNENYNLSNGRKVEIKVMPETASARAIEKLGELGFNVTLKEINGKAVYHLESEKDTKLFGFIKKKAKIEVDIDAENDGKVINVKKPWWAFLASGI